MLQKAKSIKKTIKTEVKAIAYGTERVDKRGKPVTSIADRTNVSAFFFRFTWCLIFFFERKIVYTLNWVSFFTLFLLLLLLLLASKNDGVDVLADTHFLSLSLSLSSVSSTTNRRSYLDLLRRKSSWSWKTRASRRATTTSPRRKRNTCRRSC
jgi:hypothetical protein